MSNLNENLKAIEELRAKLSSIEIPPINMEVFKQMNISGIDVTRCDREIKNFKNPLVELAEEQNNYLRDLVKYNEDISRYNKELVGLNEKILNKINSLDETLTFLNTAFANKSENDDKSSEKQLSLLVQLMDIIENKDSSKLEKFMSNFGAPATVGLLIEVLKIKFGLG